ncbi:unnamed protein product [Ostreobium quekettii]|uniref:Nitric oxide synthase-interacting protein zinc-finger domain-containing protein n=1 Tax=Ostreobium quekettii TaxID=121088 RepID=A0A8S1J1L2_9CHLO|nr:unnamed protein product [Ostreobium quekettii]|eukprot:evm.model.scf_3497.1 EVM.evm.TU.scf_3497.1   scf_3497:3741-7506(-)
MGRGGQRHSKNAGVMGSEALTYSEKRKLGYGTVTERLGKDSQGNFDDCALTLQPAKDPVCTPDGIVYSREAILENLLEQRKANKRKLAAWEAQQAEEQRQADEKARLQAEARLVSFDRQNHMGASDSTVNKLQSAFKQTADHMHDDKMAKSVVSIQENKERMKELKSFWHPSQTPQARGALNKPSMDTLCPGTGRKLRLKDLIQLNFTRAPPEDGGRYMDPVTRTTFTNTSKLVVLKPGGVVMLQETYEKCVKPDGKYEGKEVTKKDVIQLRHGGTGFCARDEGKVEAKRHCPLGPGNGLADLRGQHQGPRSHGGLQFWN